MSRSARATLSLTIAIGVLLGSRPDALGLTLTVQSSDASPVGSYRWMVEVDTTHPVTPNTPDSSSLGVSIHASYAPVIMQGTQADADTALSSLPSGRYFLTVLPDSGHTISGAKFNGGDPSVTVTVTPWPVPTAQISVFVYEDNTAISGAPELPAERGLAGFNVRVTEIFGQQYWDAFGNPLGTTYDTNGDVLVLGTEIFTDENGRALIKNLPPGKYNVSASPRDGQDWVQTTSIGGTPQIPVVIKAGEPPIFTQGGPSLLDMHAFIGFVKPFRTLAAGPGTITGRCVNLHTEHPPSAVIQSGTPIADCYVGMNIIEAGTERGVLAQAANPDGTFTLTSIPAGTYQVTVWDKPLDNVMNIRQVNVTGGTVDIGDIPMARWVGTFEGSVFRDVNEDGFRDPGEVGIPGQAINLRFRDGSMMQSTETDVFGDYSLKEIPLLGKWTITEIDFARFKVTGATTFTDQGGTAPPAVNTDLGLVLLEGMIVHPDQVNRADWGKTEYGPGADNTFDTVDDENGGIAGIIYYASTRAENDPRLAAADDWEPGIPRVQINLYRDTNVDGVIDDVNGDSIVTLADVDNHPFGDFPGPGDLDRNYPGQTPGNFDGGDAVQLGTSDSFDDNLPTGCVGPMPFLDCAESLPTTWNQMRIALFDGGWQFVTHVPGGFDTGNPEEDLPLGTYIAEVALPPGYELVKEEDLNVLTGDEFEPTPQLLPPPCVGDLHEVPPFLTKDGVTEAPFAGDMRPLCDRKQVSVSRGQNAVTDFHLFTQVPKAGRIVGQAVNPFAVQTNPADPNFGGFLTLPWIPISIRDYLGNEITRVYTDEYGAYNALVPSTVNAHVPQPSGYSANVVVICANSPADDPQYNPNFDQPCLPLDVMPAKTTYIATVLNSITAFQSSLTDVDCEFPSGTPVISEVNGTTGGPWVSPAGDTITITSPGTVMGRDFGFEATQGSGTVTLGGVPLTISSWSNTSIDAVVPPLSTTGQLAVTRDNGRSTVMGVTLTVELTVPTYVTTSIQAAIDAAAVNALVLVPPGTYQENLIISQPVRLQGYGTYSTIIDASAFEANRADWATKLDTLITSMAVDTVPGQRLDLSLEDGAGITILAKDTGPTAFTSSPRARVDGFTITGATRGGGVFLNGYVHYLQVSNNRFQTNQGMFAGALRVGWQSLVNDTLTGYTRSFNDNLLVHHNQFDRNGSLGDGGAVAFYNGTDAYAVTDNYFCGNYSSLNGGCISHFGHNPDGLIARNQFLFNEAFGEGGAVQMTGEFVPAGGPLGLLGDGTGSVTIDANLMQGNYVGDDGGGISLYGVNGLDVATNPDDPTQWYHVDIINNRIVNNLSGFAAGGIALSESVNVRIVHNTIANNDSTSVANFGPGSSQQSLPAGAGIVARGNSPGLAAASGIAFANPLLVNNIIRENRSFIWDQTANGGLGGLVPDPTSPFWDLEVFGQLAGVGMDPRSCVLSADALGGDPHNPTVVYHASNVAGDPAFVAPYLNTISISPGPIPTPTFTPLTPTGDYDIGSGSVARNAGDGGIAGSFGSELATDFDGDARPSAAVDIGADEFQEVVPGGGSDTTGPATRDVQASPNPTAGAASVSVTATVDDSGTGGSTIMAAEWSVGAAPATAGTGTSMSGSFGSVQVVVSASVTVPGGDFTVWVRGKDSNGNWGPAAARLVYETTTSAGDTVGPKTERTKVNPNPTEGAGTVTLTATAYDIVTGGSTIADAEWWVGSDPGEGNGAPMTAVDGFFDEVAENVTAMVPTALADFTIFLRSQDVSGNWGAVASVFVQVTDPGQGSGGPLFVQCPGDADGDAVVDGSTNVPYSYPSDVRCKHITGGDGFINMADGRRIYTFGFNDVTGVPPNQVLETGINAANFPAPRIVVDEGDEFYLNLTNVGMVIRPDLFDPHSVHWHGFPQAAAIFDGVPEASVSINMGSTLTYYYKVIEPGTYMYHCHVEATEHMQMGMLGNLYVRPRQNRFPNNYCFATGMVTAGSCAGHKHSNPDENANRNLDDPLDGDTYAYDDGDGSTRYDVDYPVQIGSLDPDFHDASEGVQALPFALMMDKYPMLNGRGYPDTMNPAPIMNTADEPKPSQKDHTKIDATVGQKVLLRISNLNVTRLYTLATLGIPMKVIGYNARVFRGPSPDGGVTPGKNLYYETNSLTLGGGEAVDVILDTTGVTPGTYFLYTTNLNYLTNNEEQFGGMMTEITITP